MRHRGIVVVVVLATALLCPRAVSAATLSQLQVEPIRGGGAHIRLTFSDVAPRYRLLGRGALEIAVEMRDVRAAPGVRTTAAGAGSVAGVRLVGSGTTAMLLIALNAPAAMHVTALAREIDVAVDPPGALNSASGPVAAPSVGPGQGDVVEIVPLKYADISEVVGVLVEGQTIASNDTFAPQPSQLGQASPTFGGTFSGTYNGGFGQPLQQGVTPNPLGNGQQALGQRVNQQIAVDRRLNAIVLSGTAAQVTALRSIIEKLDVPLSSVVLETQIVELTETAAKSIGIDYSAGGGPVASGKYAIATLSPATASVSLQAAIYDVVSRGGGRLIARPRVVALNGAPASILTGDAIPIITNITSFGSSTVTQQQVQYVNVGVNLQIQPRISSDGYVTSHIFSEVSSVTGYVQSFPQISQRVATTQATVRDGESFVIGGLIRESELQNLDKIPGLSSLPIIGGFFRNRHELRASTNLYIVVTPHIVARGSSAGAPPTPTP